MLFFHFVVTYQLLVTCIIAILSIWLAGVMSVAKSKFALGEEGFKNQNPPRFQREFAQLVHSKLLEQCDVQHLQKRLSLQSNAIKQQQQV